MRVSRLGSRIICGNRDLLYEEAPECYKSIAHVIKDLVDAGLITIIANLKPLVTFKTLEGVEEKTRRDRKEWQNERSQARKIKRRNE